MKRRMLIAVAVTLLASVVACSSPDDEAGPDRDHVAVYAEARIQPTLEELAAAYNEEHPGKKIEFTFGAGADLAAEAGEADLYIDRADRVDDVVAREGRGAPLDFGSDPIQIVVALGNPNDISRLDVFGDDPDTLSGLCADDVGCGQSARAVLEAAGVTPAPDRIEPTATDLLNAVADGELDAGLLFRIQVSTAPSRVEGVDFPSENNDGIAYSIGVLSDDEEALAFATWLVESAEAEAILVRRGFRAQP